METVGRFRSEFEKKSICGEIFVNPLLNLRPSGLSENSGILREFKFTTAPPHTLTYSDAKFCSPTRTFAGVFWEGVWWRPNGGSSSNFVFSAPQFSEKRFVTNATVMKLSSLERFFLGVGAVLICDDK